jgi:hypothetical protein
MNKKVKVKQCFQCDKAADGQEFHGYSICKTCKSELGLMQDDALKGHLLSYKKIKDKDPKKPSFEEEVRDRLSILEKAYISKKIKLLHIQERLKLMRA